MTVDGTLGTIGLVSVEFDFDEVFDDDYLYFYETLLTAEKSDADAELIWQLGRVAVGDRVLDLACGHGRIANRLAARGASVTGYDLTPRFLEEARAEAAGLGQVEGFAPDGSPLSHDSRRMIVRAVA